MNLRLFASLALLGTPAAASDVFEGNGVGGAYIGVRVVTGPTLELTVGSTHAENTGVAFLALSDGVGPVEHPILGTVGVDTSSQFFGLAPIPLNGGLETVLLIDVPYVPSLFGLTYYGATLTFESVGLSLSRTARVTWEFPDSFRPVAGSMQTGRLMHTATALGTGPLDNRTKVLIAGGADGSFMVPIPTATTDIYQPALNALEPGPSMSIPRSGHTATQLPDGRVLITGGATTGGVVSETTEVYDPETNTFLAGPPLSTPRSAHRATLLNDGRVFVSGGFSDWQNASTQFIAALNTSQDTAEIFDPVLNSWSTVAESMAARRSGHGQDLLPDGTVLITSGIRAGGQGWQGGSGGGGWGGGQVPWFTTSHQIFDPVTEAFSSIPDTSFGRAFHGVSILADGMVLLTGGLITDSWDGAAVSSRSSITWDGATWHPNPLLPNSVSFHTQVQTPDGRALIMGGYTNLFSLEGASQTGVRDGGAFQPLTPIGQNPQGLPLLEASGRGAHSCTPLSDGTYLIVGGSSAGDAGTFAHADAFIYVP